MAASTEHEMKDWIEAFKVSGSHCTQDVLLAFDRKEAPGALWVDPGLCQHTLLSAHQAPNMFSANIHTTHSTVVVAPWDRK